MQSSRIHQFRFRGLTVVHDRVPGPITALALGLRAGARFDGSIPGLAHMAEHMMFQGTLELDQLALNHRAAELGGNHNADTGYETIALTIEVFNEDLDTALELLMDQMYNTSVDPSRFRKECRVVLDEIRGRQEDPVDALHERAWRAFFREPLGHPICGTIGSVKAMRAADVSRFIARNFVNRNAALGVVGGVSEDALRAALARHVSRRRAGRPTARARIRRGGQGLLRSRNGHGGQSFVARFIEVDPAPRNLLALGIALDLVGADPDSHLFQAVRERHGLGYDVSAEIESGPSWAVAVLSASAHPGQARRLRQVIDEVIDASARDGFAAEDLARARKKRRYRYASLAERRIERALAHTDSALTGFPSLEEAERTVMRFDDRAVLGAWRKAVRGRSLTAMIDG
ncbi:MAG TPA: pitrilysin family protein [Candidatus Bathyarchaeia archaeon]|nr:pitrilysin family protein [Candidatus Bathyarchaeia archaeon]